MQYDAVDVIQSPFSRYHVHLRVSDLVAVRNVHFRTWTVLTRSKSVAFMQKPNTETSLFTYRNETNSSKNTFHVFFWPLS